MAKNLLKKTASVIITVLLIISTSLCIFLIAKSAFKGSVSIAGYRLFYVVTGSMEPTIHAGAAALTRENEDNVYNVGDIITFISKTPEIYGQANTHRIVRILEKDGQTRYITKGDANPVEDDRYVSPEDIYGKVVWHSGDTQILGSILAFLTTPVGFLFVILLPILLITVSQLKEFTKTYKQALTEAAMQAINERTELDERKQQPEIESGNESESGTDSEKPGS